MIDWTAVRDEVMRIEEMKQQREGGAEGERRIGLVESKPITNNPAIWIQFEFNGGGTKQFHFFSPFSSAEEKRLMKLNKSKTGDCWKRIVKPLNKSLWTME